MKVITPNTETNEGSSWYPVDEDGIMRCSCGRDLIQMDEDTYRCAAGLPIYKFSQGTIVKDKFGNLLIKKIKHGNEKEN